MGTLLARRGILSQPPASGVGGGGPPPDGSHRRPITITGTTAGEQEHYPVLVDLDYDAEMQTDFTDVRFTDSDGNTRLDYWIEAQTDGVSATYWVRIPLTPANGVTKTIYAYYGYAAAPTESNGQTTFGPRGLYHDFDLEAATTDGWAHAATPNVLQKGAAGKWDDLLVYLPRICKNLDGTIYREAGTGKALIAYTASGSPGGLDNDRVGLVTTTDFSTFTRYSVNSPILTWGSGSYDESGTVWDGTDVACTSLVYTGGLGGMPNFIMYFEGNATSNAAGDNVQIGVATSTDGLTWTKSGSNPILTPGIGGDVADLYSFNAIYDSAESDSNKRWKAWYTGHRGAAYSVMYAYAASYNGPWTKQSTAAVYSGNEFVGVSQAWVDRGLYYLIVDDWSTLKRASLMVSSDGSNWRPLGSMLLPGPGGAWDEELVYWNDQAWDALDSTWRRMYYGRNTSGSSFGLAHVAWTGRRLPVLGTVDADKWPTQIGVSLESGQARIAGASSGDLRSATLFPAAETAKARTKIEATSGVAGVGSMIGFGVVATFARWNWHNTAAFLYAYSHQTADSAIDSNLARAVADSFHVYEIRRSPTTVQFFSDDVLKVTDAVQAPTADLAVRAVASGSGHDTVVDYIITRPLVAPEPAAVVGGAEF